jgi:hypothetical protein
MYSRANPVPNQVWHGFISFDFGMFSSHPKGTIGDFQLS